MGKFNQVCVWPGTLLGDTTVEEFVKWFADEGYRIEYLEEITTEPDMKDGEEVEGTGGRVDQFFKIHDDDIPAFAVPRLALGIRWIEDVLSTVNGYDKNPIYPERVKAYCSWDADPEDEDEEEALYDALEIAAEMERPDA